MPIDALMNPIFDPLLNLDPIWAIIIISVGITTIFSLISKYTTNQKRMKELRNSMKEAQKKMKEHRNDPAKMMEIQKSMMQDNMEYMRHNFKVMLITFIPIIIMFAWLHANLTYHPIAPGEPFYVELQFQDGTTGNVLMTPVSGINATSYNKSIENNKVKFDMTAAEGDYLLTFNYNEKIYDKELKIGGKKYKNPVKILKNDPLKQIVVSNKRVHPLGDFRLFGWQPGWLSLYILISIVVSLLLKKILDIA